MTAQTLRRQTCSSARRRYAAVFRACFQEDEIVVEDVFDPEEHVAKPRTPHQRRQRISAGRDRRRHALDQVVNAMQARIDDRVTERLEPIDVERDVVVDEEDAAGAAVTRVADVVDDALDGKRKKLRPRISIIEQKLQSTCNRAMFRDIDRPPHQRVPSARAARLGSRTSRHRVGTASRCGVLRNRRRRNNDRRCRQAVADLHREPAPEVTCLRPYDGVNTEVGMGR